MDTKVDLEGITDGYEGPSKVRGVSLVNRFDRPKPYGLSWREEGSRKYEFYLTPKERDARYAEVARSRGRGVAPMSSAEVKEWRAFKEAIAGAAWQDVVAVWRRHSDSGKVSGIQVAEACTQFMAAATALAAEGKLSPDTFRQKKHKAAQFAARFGAERMTAVTPVAIEEWLDDLELEGGTFNSWLKHVRTIYSFHKIQPNPASEVPLVDTEGEIGILTPEDTDRLFQHALTHAPEALGRLAAEAFAGIRFGSACRLERSDFNFTDRGLLLPKKKLKTKRRHYIDGLPKNLWAWLERTNDACWAMTPAEYMHLKTRLFQDSKVPHLKNCLRHSFATYHVAAFKDPGKTATLLCHRDQEMLWDHYNGVATSAAGKAYFAVVPKK